MEAKAIAKGLRISPIRARLVADMIRGKNASEALSILEKNITWMNYKLRIKELGGK